MSTASARILVVDDDPDIHGVVEVMLAGLGYELEFCSTGAAALEAMRRHKPDLVLLDIMLTQPTEGLQVACQMRQDVHLKDIPIIFVSAVGESMGAEYAREVCPVALDADLFLEKPLEASRVREAVAWVLAQRSGQVLPKPAGPDATEA